MSSQDQNTSDWAVRLAELAKLAPLSAEQLGRYDEFCSLIRGRLERGARDYGDKSFERSPGDIIDEVIQEVADTAGWSFIAYCRLIRLKSEIDTLVDRVRQAT